MTKSIVYIDMDGVLADFGKAVRNHPKAKTNEYKDNPDNIPEIFEKLEPIPDAKNAIKILFDSDKFELFILTTAPWHNPNAWMHKRLWVENHFGDVFYKKIIITHRKDLLIGDYLIDDRTAKGAAEFKGKHLHFGWDYINKKNNEFPDWNSIINYFNLS